MSVFDFYAAYYDLIYRDKDYAAESDYVLALLREAAPQPRFVLELGCGTGGHAVEFAKRGLDVVGIDLSAPMVQLAEARRLASGPLADRMRFQTGDIRHYRERRRFDAVVSLFHVMSYQTTNADLLAALATARAHLGVGGLFLFDCWYGPAVLSDRPRELTKQVFDSRIEIERHTCSTMHVNDNCVNVHFDITITARESGACEHMAEDHRMRYLFLPELVQYLAWSGFVLRDARSWMSDKALDDRSWYACLTCQAV
jgi:SAM-dependent methyltransferase